MLRERIYENAGMVIVSELHIYPVKSLKGIQLPEVGVGPKGPHMDRRLLIVDKNGRYMTQRLYPRMALIGVTLEGMQLTFRAPGVDSYFHTLAEMGQKREVITYGTRERLIATIAPARQCASSALTTCRTDHTANARCTNVTTHVVHL